MKKIIVCLILIFTIILSLCGCQATINDEGKEREIYDSTFVVIEKPSNLLSMVYDRNTKIVYYLRETSYGDCLAPYLIHQDGCVYGAIFQDGKYIPVPYASAPLE